MSRVIQGKFNTILQEDKDRNNKKEHIFVPPKEITAAYKELLKAYEHQITYSNIFGFKPRVECENKQYEIAANKTITDFQHAYTDGNLSKDLAHALIDQRHPDFSKNISKAYKTTIYFSEGLTINQKKNIISTLEEINKRYPKSLSPVQIYGGKNVTISTTDSSTFGKIYYLFNDINQHFNKHKSYRTQPLKELVERHLEDKHLFLSIGSKRVVKRREADRENKDRVTTKETLSLKDIKGTPLHMLSEHISSSQLNDVFSHFMNFNASVKATIDKQDTSESAFIDLKGFVRKSETIEQYKKRVAFLKSSIKNIADLFNDPTDNITITSELVRSTIEQTYIDHYGFESPFYHATNPHSEKTDILTPMSLEEIDQISHDDLYNSIQELLPSSLHEVAFQYNIDLKNTDHRIALAQKLSDLVYDGRLAETSNKYKTPEAFSGKIDLKVYLPRKVHHKMFAEPVTWDESAHGITPQFIIDDGVIEKFGIKDDDRLSVDLSYQAGIKEEFTIKKVVHVPKQQIKHAPTDISFSQISSGLKLPKNNVWVGVVTEEQGQKLFTPSLGNGATYKILENNGIAPGDIIKAHVSPKSGAITSVHGEYGNTSQNNGWNILSLLEAGIEIDFPDDVLDGVELIVPKPDEYRKDFTDINFITIDPETARDYDDAVHVKETENGFQLMVAIADVTHYVKQGSKVLEEAYKRGNSTYLPGFTHPMLPEQLSNNLCSLKEGENRACLVSTIDINSDGTVESFKFDIGVMRSRARFTYEQVQDAIEGNPDEKTEPFLETHIKSILKLSNALAIAENNRGKLTLDTQTQSIDIDKDGEYDLKLEVQNESHKIIERCMIASNVCAINFLIENDAPFLVRSHGHPNKKTLESFHGQLIDLGIVIPEENPDLRVTIENIIKQASNLNNSDDKDKVMNMMIRSQAQAKYEDVLSPHFALGEDNYTHETSPIRRIPDYYIHNLIKTVIAEKAGAIDSSELNQIFNEFNEQSYDIAKHASETERTSELIQKNVEARHKIEWMKGNLDRTFNATVLNVSNGNLQISVTDHKIKTTIPESELPRKAGITDTYKINSQIKVTPIKTETITGIIKFAIA